MKVKLKKFIEFSSSILPNEAKYLASVDHKIKDHEKQRIILAVINNAIPENKYIDFNIEIDKRKYTYIKSWIEDKLSAIDVDKTILWLLDLRKNILTDSVSYQQEVEFLNYLSHYQKIDFYFQNLYDLAQEYQSYLLIRMRYKDHEVVANFLNSYKEHYLRAKKIHDKLYKATGEITSQYTLNDNETIYWEKWLKKIFNTQAIDGKNRYQAFVLLAFMYTNYNENTKLKNLFDTIDHYLSQGELYSRRLLSNYYASCVLMHSKEGDLETAEYYGFLSIRQRNDDTLMYLNNLVAITLKREKYQLAHQLLEDYVDLFESTHNDHQRNSYVSYRIRVLTEQSAFYQAESLAKNYLRKNKKQVLKHRWHHFFTSYINVLIVQEKYLEVLKVAKKYGLKQREKERKLKSNYVPNISWSISLSRYMEGEISSERLLKEIQTPIENLKLVNNQKQLMIQVIDKLSQNLPEAFLSLKSHI